MRHIRPYQPEDLDALYEICLRTGAAGGDARTMVRDPSLFGALFAAPYAVLEPEHAWVLDDGAGRTLGYVLGALDTTGFEARCEHEWWPNLRRQHPLQSDGTTLDDLLVHLIHHRPSPSPTILDTYPSHLHIDLLPEAQGAGWGRRLLATLYEQLAADGSPGVHWGVSTANEPAIAFYRHLSAVELTNDGAIISFGHEL